MSSKGAVTSPDSSPAGFFQKTLLMAIFNQIFKVFLAAEYHLKTTKLYCLTKTLHLHFSPNVRKGKIVNYGRSIVYLERIILPEKVKLCFQPLTLPKTNKGAETSCVCLRLLTRSGGCEGDTT